MATILIVDDRPNDREYLTTLLSYGGHRLLEASDGADGLAVVKHEHPELVIADILMPTMDGYEFVRQLRGQPDIAQTPVIFYTAHYHDEEARALAHDCGVFSVITKPSEPEIVLDVVQAALGNHQPARTAPSVQEFDREHLQLLTDKLSREAASLRIANGRLAALVELGIQFGSELDPPKLLKDFCEAAREIIGARYALTGIPGEDGQRLRFLFTSGMDAESAARLGTPDSSQGVLKTVLSESRCVRVMNAVEEFASLGFAPGHPRMHSFLGAPIVSPSKVYGWLALFDKIGVDAFSDEDERLASMLSAEVGRVYENGSLYADIQNHAAELEREVAERMHAEQRQAILLAVSQALSESTTLAAAAQRVLQIVCESLEWQFGTVWVVDDQAQVLKSIAIWTGVLGGQPELTASIRRMTLERGEELPGRVWGSGQTDWLADLSQEAGGKRSALHVNGGLHAALAFPIVIQEHVRGVVEVMKSRFREPNQETLRVFLGICGDLAQFMERKQAEELLSATEARLRLTLDAANDPFVSIDMSGRILDWNRQAEIVFGWSRADALGKLLSKIIVPESKQEVPGREDVRAPGHGLILNRHVEMKAVHRDGHEFPVELVVWPVDVGGAQTFSAFVRDITELKKLESEIRESQERLQHVVSSSPAVLYTLTMHNDEFKLAWISDNVSQMMGYSVEDVFRPRWWVEGIHPDDLPRSLAEIRHCLKSDDRLAHEYRFLHQDGTYRWIRSELRFLRHSASEAIEVVGSWSDITERKKLEDQFRQAQKMEAIGKLAGGIAHDFNNLLTVINGYSEIVLAKLAPNDPYWDMINEIRKAGDRAASLTRQLLAFSRKQMLVPAVLDLNRLVFDMEKMLGRLIGEDFELVIRAVPDLWPVKADAGQLEQVIMNIVLNAQDAITGDGTITIETTNVELDETYPMLHPESLPGQYARLAISDNGCGMDEATRSRIFEPFFTTKGPEKGTGLGLATVWGIVKQSGGHIEVYSEVGIGTTFKIYLPRCRDEVQAKSAQTGIQNVAGGAETILLVEDEPGVRTLGRLVLQNQGYKVLEACDGEAAVQLATSYKGEIHLIVTDIVMPKISGRQLVERLSIIRPRSKVLYVSGYTDDAIVRHGVLNPSAHFLQKPFSALALSRKVRDVLDT